MSLDRFQERVPVAQTVVLHDTDGTNPVQFGGTQPPAMRLDQIIVASTDPSSAVVIFEVNPQGPMVVVSSAAVPPLAGNSDVPPVDLLAVGPGLYPQGLVLIGGVDMQVRVTAALSPGAQLTVLILGGSF
jgi:hypothetical protein